MPDEKRRSRGPTVGESPLHAVTDLVEETRNAKAPVTGVAIPNERARVKGEERARYLGVQSESVSARHDDHRAVVSASESESQSCRQGRIGPFRP